ncbi:MBOAT family protein [Mangrovimicrobium sediminis]|uniref:Probable alginate O-acetylase AlgI n=1 Tax=Mangrovimicrobium sediminis TaxID=2562682 RepID=A0A4Z0LZF7_9GAMM|nr:MBOAT family O-acyltransferase [Haliea sp. SAOS-164]TGD72547.1 MBOAT family protein [Haliea sp. SAOS-164]
MGLVSLANLPLAAAFVALFWLTPRRLQAWYLVASGGAFLVYQGQYLSLLALAGLGAGCYATATLFARWFGAGRAALLAMVALVLFFVAYKLVLANAGNTFVLLGAAYYVLRMLHYVIESYRGRLPAHGPAEFAAYLFFLPTLFVGPINRFGEFVRDERRRRWDTRLFHTGLERILFGYFKVVVLANYVLDTKLAAYIESVGGDDTALGAWLLCVEYGLELYLRFGGYCDVAIGMAALLGYRIVENFNYPFLRSDINAFWRSWHISLSAWCRDYIFTPAAFRLRSPAAGVILSMVVLGLWHEISLRYLAWGAYHGVGIVIFQYWCRLKPALPTTGRLPGWLTTPLATLLTFNFVVMSFAITRKETLGEALQVFRVILGV